ncbi:MAG: cobaltochelatase subunit CobN [Deltaproteobacteria bacterium]|jgi:cobaltochelatase CobN|nr:cobaltochelatase subunit CobN [Deltaproteobacteria bacterium]
MKITILSGSGFHAHLTEAVTYLGESGFNLFAGRALYSPEIRDSAIAKMVDSDINLVFASEEPFWEEIYSKYAKESTAKIPLLWLTYDMRSNHSNVDKRFQMEALTYIQRGGSENAVGLIKFLKGIQAGNLDDVPPPAQIPPYGIWHPEAPQGHYDKITDYLSWYQQRENAPQKYVGLVVHRHFWSVDKPLVEEALIQSLEAEEIGVIPVFLSGETTQDSVKASNFFKETFCDPDVKASERKARVSAIIKMTSLFQHGGDHEVKEGGQHFTPTFVGDDSPAHGSVKLFRELNVPILQPVVSHRQPNSEWEKNPQGIAMELSWSVTMPEFEGVIEPHYLGGTEKAAGALGTQSPRKPHPERVTHFAKRVAAWVRLASTPPQDRKIAFIVHNAPCASVEATCGTASRLDVFASLKEILGALQKTGHRVNVPQEGEDIVKDIMEHKAIADFRWTTVEEIVGKGGSLCELANETYLNWFSAYPEDIKSRLIETWGHPPGEEINEVPPAMVKDGKIIITGRPWGENAVVCVQPKRGCAGARCDGRVCLILHDPLIPPPHQYLATYRWLQEKEGFGADLIIHVGTHGNLEFLPGKSAGLSESCLPDLSLHHAPHVYIYNADVTSDGLIAKRRSYASLVDHAQTVHTEAGLYGDLSILRSLLGDHSRAGVNSVRRRELETLIREKAQSLPQFQNLASPDCDFGILARRLRDTLHQTATTLIEDGLHVFGNNPQGADLVSFIHFILRFESPENPGLRSLLAQARGMDLTSLLENPSDLATNSDLTKGEIIEGISRESLQFIREVLEGTPPCEVFQNLTALAPSEQDNYQENILKIGARILDIASRVSASDEIGALLNALGGGYTTPGPSALISRGREDVLPTGRNFYTQDPKRLPTPAAYQVGKILAEATISKFKEEEGRYPESIAFFWISSDLLHADGEDFAEMLALIGVKPTWDSSGKVTGIEVVPLEELARPRIDITCRMTGILRDSFPEAANLLDHAVRTVAALDEDLALNFPRRHTLEDLEKEGELSPEEREEKFYLASSRIYSTAPGSCSSGIYFAVMAAAWETMEDLSDIYIQHNAYLYSGSNYGLAAPNTFKKNLTRVDINSHKIFGEEEDFLNCGGFFAGAGGLSIAAQVIKGIPIKNYLADTREQKSLKIRSLAEELGRSFRARLFNPTWVASMRKHGYKGAAEISRRVSNTFGWQVTTREVDDTVFNEITKTFFLDPVNREFFEKNNPWALEEIGRRLMEAETRGLWKADPELLRELKENYLSLEGVLEESTESFGGDLQGGGVDILTTRELSNWKKKMDDFFSRNNL